MKSENEAEEQRTHQLAKLRRRIEDLKAPGDESAKVAKLAEKIAIMKEGICIIGCDGKIVGTNAAFEELTGYTRDELIGESPLKIHPERERGLICARLSECVENGFARSIKTFFLRKNRREIPVHLEFDNNLKEIYKR